MKGADFQESGDQFVGSWEAGVDSWSDFGVLLDMIGVDRVCKGRSVGESGMRAGELTLECVYE